MICPHCTKEISDEDLEKQKLAEERKTMDEFRKKLFSSIMSGKKEDTKQVIQEYNGKIKLQNNGNV